MAVFSDDPRAHETREVAQQLHMMILLHEDYACSTTEQYKVITTRVSKCFRRRYGGRHNPMAPTFASRSLGDVDEDSTSRAIHVLGPVIAAAAFGKSTS